MSTEDKKRRAQKSLVARLLEGTGRARQDQRHAAYDNSMPSGPLHDLVSKVAERPTQIADDDIAAAKASGLTEDEIFELVVCAAVGQATRQYETALQALAAASSNGEE
ncbi:MAG: hypothetical protein ACREOS_05465 [Candidatus Dormibacteraceae bacterium]